MIDDSQTSSVDDLAAGVVDDLEVSGYDEDDYDDDLEDDYDDDLEDDFDDEEDYDDDDEEQDLDLDDEDYTDEDEAYVMRGEPSSGLLSFYDRLRERVLSTVERKGGKLGTGMVQVLLVAPDLFMLLARLALDRNVPASTRSLVGGALAYFVIPVDLLPEALIGVGGYTDDVVLAATVLSHVFSGDLAPYVQRHWSGSRELQAVLRDIAGVGRSLLGENLYGRLKGLLARRGVDVEAEEGSGSGFEDDEAARAGA